MQKLARYMNAGRLMNRILLIGSAKISQLEQQQQLLPRIELIRRSLKCCRSVWIIRESLLVQNQVMVYIAPPPTANPPIRLHFLSSLRCATVETRSVAVICHRMSRPQACTYSSLPFSRFARTSANTLAWFRSFNRAVCVLVNLAALTEFSQLRILDATNRAADFLVLAIAFIGHGMHVIHFAARLRVVHPIEP